MELLSLQKVTEKLIKLYKNIIKHAIVENFIHMEILFCFVFAFVYIEIRMSLNLRVLENTPSSDVQFIIKGSFFMYLHNIHY